jgi:hypothetical protein
MPHTFSLPTPAASLAYRLAALAWLLPGADNADRERLHNIADLLHGANPNAEAARAEAVRGVNALGVSPADDAPEASLLLAVAHVLSAVGLDDQVAAIAPHGQVARRLIGVREAMRSKALYHLDADIPGGAGMRSLVLARFDAMFSDAAIAGVRSSGSDAEGWTASGVLARVLFDELLMAWRLLGRAVDDHSRAIAARPVAGPHGGDGGAPPAVH